MSAKRAKRKLTAVLSADVQGYGRLLGEAYFFAEPYNEAVAEYNEALDAKP